MMKQDVVETNKIGFQTFYGVSRSREHGDEQKAGLLEALDPHHLRGQSRIQPARTWKLDDSEEGAEQVFLDTCCEHGIIESHDES